MHSMHKLLMQCVTATVAVSLSIPATSQEPAAQAPVIKSQVNLVNIFATVRDKKKHIMPSLKKEDFHVFEDEQEQKIAFFSNERALPITLGLLIDTSLSEENRLPAEQEAATGFLNQVLRKGDEAMVISFGTDVDLLSDFTDDRAQLDRAIRSARINAPNVSMVNAGPLPPESRTRGLRNGLLRRCLGRVHRKAGDRGGPQGAGDHHRRRRSREQSRAKGSHRSR